MGHSGVIISGSTSRVYLEVQYQVSVYQIQCQSVLPVPWSYGARPDAHRKGNTVERFEPNVSEGGPQAEWTDSQRRRAIVLGEEHGKTSWAYSLDYYRTLWTFVQSPREPVRRARRVPMDPQTFTLPWYRVVSAMHRPRASESKIIVASVTSAVPIFGETTLQSSPEYYCCLLQYQSSVRTQVVDSRVLVILGYSVPKVPTLT